MKRIVRFAGVLLITVCLDTPVHGQMDSLRIAEFEGLANDLLKQYKLGMQKIDSLTLLLDGYKSDITPDTDWNLHKRRLDRLFDELQAANAAVDSIYADKEALYRIYSHQLLLPVDSLRKWVAFPEARHTTARQVIPSNETGQQERGEEKQAVFVFIGEDKVIPLESPDKRMGAEYQTALRTVFSEDSKLYLGDFSVPVTGQRIRICKKDCDSTAWYRFRKLGLYAHRGFIRDVQVYLTDDDGVEYLFANKSPIALQSYVKKGKHHTLYLQAILTNEESANTRKTNKSLQSEDLNLADVLMYTPNPGRYYVPNELHLEFPTAEAAAVPTASRLVYKVYQQTGLRHVLELRSYSDALALLNNADNGLATFEGKIHLHFMSVQLINRNVLFFNKVTPFIVFSKLDSDGQYVVAESGLENFSPLEIVQKSTVTTGLDLELLNWKPSKTDVYTFGLDLTGAYNIARISSTHDIGSYAYGVRPKLSIAVNDKLRLLASYTLMRQQIANDHVGELDFTARKGSWYGHIAGEISYILGPSASDAGMFARVGLYDDIGKDAKHHFYQLQIGYRFSFGI